MTNKESIRYAAHALAEYNKPFIREGEVDFDDELSVLTWYRDVYKAQEARDHEMLEGETRQGTIDWLNSRIECDHECATIAQELIDELTPDPTDIKEQPAGAAPETTAEVTVDADGLEQVTVEGKQYAKLSVDYMLARVFYAARSYARDQGRPKPEHDDFTYAFLMQVEKHTMFVHNILRRIEEDIRDGQPGAAITAEAEEFEMQITRAELAYSFLVLQHPDPLDMKDADEVMVAAYRAADKGRRLAACAPAIEGQTRRIAC